MLTWWICLSSLEGYALWIGNNWNCSQIFATIDNTNQDIFFFCVCTLITAAITGHKIHSCQTPT